ncbi:hypothetical protein ES705_31078 [subsurface metagenome]
MMNYTNEIPQLLSDTGITAFVVLLMYRIIVKLLKKIPNQNTTVP